MKDVDGSFASCLPGLSISPRLSPECYVAETSIRFTGLKKKQYPVCSVWLGELVSGFRDSLTFFSSLQVSSNPRVSPPFSSFSHPFAMKRPGPAQGRLQFGGKPVPPPRTQQTNPLKTLKRLAAAPLPTRGTREGKHEGYCLPGAKRRR